jgi:hypothetical protein
MKTNDDRDIEGLLAACRLKAASPGLRERILKAARSGDNAYLRWKGVLKKSLVVCPLVLAMLFALDAALSHSEQIRIQGLIAVHGPSLADSDDAALAWAEVSGDTIGSELLVGRRMMLVQRKDFNTVRRELAALLKEEFESHENSKSIN